MLHDLRYALRGFITHKGFALVVVLCLGTGIGVNATIFSVVDGVLIQPFDYEDPDRLVVIRMTQPASDNWYAGVSYPELRDLKESTRTMSAVAVAAFRSFTVADSGDPDRYRGAAVSSNMFSMLGVRPVLGRDFIESDDVPGAAGVVILSDELWTMRYQADPNVLGHRVLLNGLPHEVIGVMKPGFKFPESQLLWVPMVPLFHMQPRDDRSLRPYARLAAGATLTQANEEVRAITSRQAEQYPATNEGWIGQVIDLRTENIPDDVTLVLWLMMGAATLVLFIACSNAANLLLARATVRRREISVRAALGAGRGRIVRQLLTESAVFGLLSVPLGLAIAYAGTQMLTASMPPDQIPYYITWRIDWRSVVYAVVVALGTTVVFGLVPAWHATRGTLHDELKEGTRGNSGARSLARNALVIAQISLAIVSLVGAALFVPTFINLDDYEVGFDPAPLVTMRVFFSGEEYVPEGAKARATRDLVERFERLPGVRGVFASNMVPLDGGGSGGPLQIDGVASEPGREPEASLIGVTPGFLRTLGVEVVAGENFSEAQGWARTQVALINQTMASRHFAGTSPLGRRVRVYEGAGEATWFTIIGVIPDVKNDEIDPDDVPSAVVYVPHQWQETQNTGFTVRVDGDPAALGPALRREVREAAPVIPVFAIRTVEELRRLSFWQFALFGWIFGIIGAVALLLAAVGVFGVLSYAVSQRTREIGVRMALGASQASVRTLIVRQGLILAAIGIAIGLVAATFLTGKAVSLLYNVTPTDPLSYIVVALFLLVMAGAASYVPARRAMRVNPIEALRGE